MKFPSLLRLGLVVLVVAISLYLIPVTWIKTRNFVPLGIPASISNGHFRSPDFKIDLRGMYFVGSKYLFEPTPPYANCSDVAWQNTEWKVFKNGLPVPITHDYRSGDSNPGEFTGRHYDFFNAGPGTYSIDLEVTPGPQCLKMTGAWLWVTTPQEKYWKHYLALCTICFFLGWTGIVLLFRGAFLSPRERTVGELNDRSPISQSPGYTRTFGSRRRRPMPRFHGLPDFGLMHIAVALPVLVIFLYVWIDGPRSMGVRVHLIRPNEIRTSVSTQTKPLRVWLNICGEFFVNDRQVSRDELQDAVRYELAHRVDPTVYFEADGNPYFQNVAFAMNEIRQASGTVMWLTPGTKSELASQTPSR